MIKMPWIRRQLWMVTVFVTCAIAVFLWASESSTYIYKIAQSKFVVDDDRKNNFLSPNFDDGDEKSRNEKLSRLNFDIMTNKSSRTSTELTSAEQDLLSETTTLKTSKANNGSSFQLGEKKSHSDQHYVNATHNTISNQKRTNPPRPSKSKKKNKVTKFKSAPPFRWCYDNEKIDLELAEELECGLLFDGVTKGNNESYRQAKEQSKTWKSPCDYTDEQIATMASDNCELFRRNFNFLSDENVGVPLSKEESTFPLAYVMIAEKWASQVLRILSSVYRPHNLYCLTFDQHASSDFKKAMNKAVRCLKPTFLMPEEHLEIYWADISLLKATLNCMRALSKRDHDWRYVQILSYNDFPLKTNLEMVRILRQFDGANDAELGNGQSERYVHYHSLSDIDRNRINESRPIPPAGIVIYKGSFAATLSKEFVRWVFENKEAQQFLEWSAPTWAPEEQFWATLVHNQHLRAPGRFPGSCLEYYRHANVEKKWISRYQVWYSGCEGTWVSGSCVFGVGDLPALIKRPELIAHKFYQDFEQAAFYCLAKRHYEKTYKEEDDWEYDKVELNMEYYKNLPAVAYQRMNDKENFNCALVFHETRD